MELKESTEVNLVDLCDLISRGITPSYTEDKKEGIIVLNQKCIRDNRINLELARLTNPNKKKVTENKILKKYDILVNSTGVGTLGRVAQIKKIDCKMTVDSHVTIVRPKKEINPIFLGYNLFMNQRYIEYLGEGSTGQTELSRVRLGETLKIKIPTLKEQESIAKILLDLDEKIEINNKLNDNLEKITNAIFKQWFVDFDFPNEDGKPYKSSDGEMVESEFGMIPKGWEVIEFSEIMKISSGKRPTKKSSDKTSEFLIPLTGASSIMGYVKEHNYNEPILVIGRVGTHGIVQRFNDKVWASDNTLVITSQYHEFSYQMLNRIDYTALNRGSTQPLITQTDIKKQKIVIGKLNLLNEFERIVGDIFNSIYNNNKEIEQLISLRDTLLPKLMSGEIRVPFK